MTDLIVIAVIAIIVGLSSLYVYKAKKSGQKCIGCPNSKNCHGSCACNNIKK